MRIRLSIAAALVAAAILPAGNALADHDQPAYNPSVLEYEPIGFFKPGDSVPANVPLDPTSGRKYNPSGNYNAFDTNFFETVTWPFRGAGDTTNDDAPGSGNPLQRHGFCAPNPVPRPETAPLSAIAGECPNHQLEYIDYYEETMRDILGKFGMTFRKYEFENPGGTNTLTGRAINPAAIVPGVDHPEDTIVVGAHYDKTTEGPASTWDSQEGHAQMIRVAKIMADYWDATGTRPSATVKFIPWDAEESGTFGSRDYAENNIVPGEEHKVRGYFNTDPCAGGYPAYRYGNPNDRVDLGIQIASEAVVTEFPTARITAFNEKADDWVEQVFDRLDDELTLDSGKQEIYISTAEAQAKGIEPDIGNDVQVGKGRPQLFSSDWANFETKGVPFFNPGPEVTGPDDEGNTHNPDALAILHTPNDNQTTMNGYAGAGPTQLNGQTFSEGWIKGMEMCAHLLAHGMLQPEMGGSQTTTGDVVAYYEALPNEAIQNENVTFNADGSYQYANPATRERVPDDQLEYSWEFGDGASATGKEVKHGYADVGTYQSVLTVRNKVTGQSDTMNIPITVNGANFDAPLLKKPAPEDQDGTFPLEWEFESQREGFERFRVEEAPDYQVAFNEDANGAIEDKWQVDQPTNDSIEPWQKSDSDTNKVRGDMAREGTSFWTGVAPENNNPVPTVGPSGGAVIQGESVMTLKQRFRVPAGGGTLNFHSLYQMEGDDRGLVQVSTTDAPDQWETVESIFVVNTAAGDDDFRACDPSNPLTLQRDFVPYNIDLAQFAGKEILLRFRLTMGAENRAATQPCGWYVDDLFVGGGTFRPIGESLEPKFEVRERPRGTFAYRVKGVYNDGVQTAASNVETVNVTEGVNPEVVAARQEAARGCEPSDGFESVAVRRLSRGERLRFDFARRSLQPVTVDVFQVSSGRRILPGRLVARFGPGEGAVQWNGRNRSGGALRDGYYFARFRVAQADGRTDVRRVTLRRVNGRFRIAKPFYGRVRCALFASAKLRSPVFGGRRRSPLRIAFRMRDQARVGVTVLRGKKPVRRFKRRTLRGEVTYRLRLPARKARRGKYRIRIVGRRGTQTERVLLHARRL